MNQLSAILPIGLYLASHLLRCVRLYVLSLGARKGGARLVAAHCMTAGLSAAIPFKLGEVMRVGLFGAAVGSLMSGIAIWLIERLNDAIAVIVLVVIMSLTMPVVADAFGALYAAGGFIIACAVGACILMETIPFLNRDLVLRSRSRKGLVLLRIVRQVETAFDQAKKLLVGRFSLTIVISLLIWASELGAIAAWDWGKPPSEHSDLILVFLSGESTALVQRMPVFAVLLLLGLSMAGFIFFKVRGRLRHA